MCGSDYEYESGLVLSDVNFDLDMCMNMDVDLHLNLGLDQLVLDDVSIDLDLCLKLNLDLIMNMSLPVPWGGTIMLQHNFTRRRVAEWDYS